MTIIQSHAKKQGDESQVDLKFTLQSKAISFANALDIEARATVTLES